MVGRERRNEWQAVQHPKAMMLADVPPFRGAAARGAPMGAHNAGMAADPQVPRRPLPLAISAELIGEARRLVESRNRWSTRGTMGRSPPVAQMDMDIVRALARRIPTTGLNPKQSERIAIRRAISALHCVMGPLQQLSPNYAKMGEGAPVKCAGTADDSGDDSYEEDEEDDFEDEDDDLDDSDRLDALDISPQNWTGNDTSSVDSEQSN